MPTDFVPTLYFKDKCPFCLKVRIFLLEAGLEGVVKVKDFVVGSSDENTIRAELVPHFEKVTFPAAEIEPGRYIADSDEIIAALARRAGRRADELPVYRNYVHGPFSTMISLWKENQELKASAAAGA